MNDYDIVLMVRSDLEYYSTSWPILNCNFQKGHVNHAFYDFMDKPMDAIHAFDRSMFELFTQAVCNHSQSTVTIPGRPFVKHDLHKGNHFPMSPLLQGCMRQTDLCRNDLFTIYR